MVTSYRRVSVLLPVPPYNWNSAFILEKNPCKNKYAKILELINKVKKKAMVNVLGCERSEPGFESRRPESDFTPTHQKRRKISSTPGSDIYSPQWQLQWTRPNNYNSLTATSTIDLLLPYGSNSMLCGTFFLLFVAAHESQDNSNHVVVLPRHQHRYQHR